MRTSEDVEDREMNKFPSRIDAHVEGATNGTKKALEFQTKARRKKIMMLHCMIIEGSFGTYIGHKCIGPA